MDQLFEMLAEHPTWTLPGMLFVGFFFMLIGVAGQAIMIPTIQSRHRRLLLRLQSWAGTIGLIGACIFVIVMVAMTVITFTTWPI